MAIILSNQNHPKLESRAELFALALGVVYGDIGTSPLGLEAKPMDTTYILGRETLLTIRKSGMSFWRKILFSMMSRNAMNPTNYF